MLGLASLLLLLRFSAMWLSLLRLLLKVSDAAELLLQLSNQKKLPSGAVILERVAASSGFLQGGQWPLYIDWKLKVMVEFAISPVLKLGDLVIYYPFPSKSAQVLQKPWKEKCKKLRKSPWNLVRRRRMRLCSFKENRRTPLYARPYISFLMSTFFWSFRWIFCVIDLSLWLAPVLRTGWRFQKAQSEREKSEETRCSLSFWVQCALSRTKLRKHVSYGWKTC